MDGEESVSVRQARSVAQTLRDAGWPAPATLFPHGANYNPMCLMIARDDMVAALDAAGCPPLSFYGEAYVSWLDGWLRALQDAEAVHQQRAAAAQEEGLLSKIRAPSAFSILSNFMFDDEWDVRTRNAVVRRCQFALYAGKTAYSAEYNEKIAMGNARESKVRKRMAITRLLANQCDEPELYNAVAERIQDAMTITRRPVDNPAECPEYTTGGSYSGVQVLPELMRHVRNSDWRIMTTRAGRFLVCLSRQQELVPIKQCESRNFSDEDLRRLWFLAHISGTVFIPADPRVVIWDTPSQSLKLNMFPGMPTDPLPIDEFPAGMLGDRYKAFARTYVRSFLLLTFTQICSCDIASFRYMLAFCSWLMSPQHMDKPFPGALCLIGLFASGKSTWTKVLQAMLGRLAVKYGGVNTKSFNGHERGARLIVSQEASLLHMDRKEICAWIEAFKARSDATNFFLEAKYVDGEMFLRMEAWVFESNSPHPFSTTGDVPSLANRIAYAKTPSNASFHYPVAEGGRGAHVGHSNLYLLEPAGDRVNSETLYGRAALLAAFRSVDPLSPVRAGIDINAENWRKHSCRLADMDRTLSNIYHSLLTLSCDYDGFELTADSKAPSTGNGANGVVAPAAKRASVRYNFTHIGYLAYALYTVSTYRSEVIKLTSDIDNTHAGRQQRAVMRFNRVNTVCRTLRRFCQGDAGSTFTVPLSYLCTRLPEPPRTIYTRGNVSGNDTLKSQYWRELFLSIGCETSVDGCLILPKQRIRLIEAMARLVNVETSELLPPIPLLDGVAIPDFEPANEVERELHYVCSKRFLFDGARDITWEQLFNDPEPNLLSVELLRQVLDVCDRFLNHPDYDIAQRFADAHGKPSWELEKYNYEVADHVVEAAQLVDLELPLDMLEESLIAIRQHKIDRMCNYYPRAYPYPKDIEHL